MTEQIIELKVGVEAPKFYLPDKDNKEVCLDDYRGKYVVLYFYPKDNTPGCTTDQLDLQEFYRNCKN